MKPTILHALDAFWTPSERVFLAKVALGRRGDRGVAVAPTLHGHSREELKERSTRIAEAIEFFRSVMKEVRQDIERDDFRRIQILYYRIRNYVEVVHATNAEQTGENGYRTRKLATLYETAEWRAFARISDRFRQTTPRYRRRKRAYDAERNGREDIKAARRTPETKARIALNERRRYHGRKLTELAERLRTERDRGANEENCASELRRACNAFLAQFDSEKAESERAAMCARWVQRVLGSKVRQSHAA